MLAVERPGQAEEADAPSGRVLKPRALLCGCSASVEGVPAVIAIISWFSSYSGQLNPLPWSLGAVSGLPLQLAPLLRRGRPREGQARILFILIARPTTPPTEAMERAMTIPPRLPPPLAGLFPRQERDFLCGA